MLFVLWLAFALRVWQLGAQSLWYDEAVSLFIAQKPVAALIAHTAGDIHPPLYYLLLHGWLAWAGPSEFAAAYFSLCFGVLLVAMSFRLARDLFGFNVAFVAALLLALSAFNLWYAQEVRMYTLVACLGVASTYCLLRLVAVKFQIVSFRFWIGVAAYASCVALGLYTHYYFVFLWLTQYLCVTLWLCALWLRERASSPLSPSETFAAPAPTQPVVAVATTPAQLAAAPPSDSDTFNSVTGTSFAVSRWDVALFRLRRYVGRAKPFAEWLARWMARAKPFVIRVGAFALQWTRRAARLARYPAFLRWQLTQILIVVLFAPWLPTAWRQISEPPVPLWRSFVSWPMAVGETLTALSLGQNFPLALGWPLVALIGLVYLLGVVVTLRQAAERLCVLLLCAVTFAPVALILLASVWTPLYHVRYTFSFAAAFYIVLALGFVWIGQRSMLLMVILLGVYVGGAWSADSARRADPFYAKDDYRSAVRFIAERARPGDAVLINAGYIYPTFVYYFPGAVDWRGRLADYTGDEAAGSFVVAQTGSLGASSQLGWGSPDADFYATDEARTTRALDLLLSKHPRVWHLRANDTVNDPQGFIRQYLQSHTLLFDETTVNVRVQGLLARRNEPSAFAPGTPLSATLGERVALLGWSGAPTATAGGAFKLSLFWQVVAPLDVDYRVSLRLYDARGRLWAQSDGAPVGPLLPMGDWPLRRLMPDARSLPIPLGVPPGDYSLQALLYDPFTQKSLPTPGGVEGARALLGRLQIVRNSSDSTVAPEIKARTQAAFDNGITLEGYELPLERARPGEAIQTELLWHARQAQTEDQEVFLQLLDERGRLWGAQQSAPVEGRYPTTRWAADEYVRDARALIVPQDVPDGVYRVVVGWLRTRDREKSSVRDGWWPLTSDSFELKRVEVKGRERVLKAPTTMGKVVRVRFGDFAQLIGYDVMATPLTSTRQLTFTLYWQASGRTSLNYKAFAHLVGPNEQIVAQRDQEPGGGALPTGGWLEGEYLVDRYVVELPDNLPVADYALYLGLYDPRTNVRLNILDNANQPAGDRWQLVRWAGGQLVR